MEGRPPLPTNTSYNRAQGYGDPFADRPRQTHFQEPQRPHRSPSLSPAPTPQPFDSTTTLAQGGEYDDDEFVEKLPLTSGQNFQSGGFYPPA
jgi:chitin synthase